MVYWLLASSAPSPILSSSSTESVTCPVPGGESSIWCSGQKPKPQIHSQKVYRFPGFKIFNLSWTLVSSSVKRGKIPTLWSCSADSVRWRKQSTKQGAWHRVLFSCSLMSNFFLTPWTVARQAPLSVEFSRQDYWRGLLFPSLGNLPDPGIEPTSPA